jgi:hypothetical protein
VSEERLFAEIASALGNGDDRICIAVLDGPIDRSHPCFLGAKLTQLETVAGTGAPGGEASAHGTHVASVIFGQPGSEVAGIAPCGPMPSRQNLPSGPFRESSPDPGRRLIFDDRGSPTSPSPANKKGVRYRCYVSHALLQNPVSSPTQALPHAWTAQEQMLGLPLIPPAPPASRPAPAARQTPLA